MSLYKAWSIVHRLPPNQKMIAWKQQQQYRRTYVEQYGKVGGLLLDAYIALNAFQHQMEYFLSSPYNFTELRLALLNDLNQPQREMGYKRVFDDIQNFLFKTGKENTRRLRELVLYDDDPEERKRRDNERRKALKFQQQLKILENGATHLEERVQTYLNARNIRR